MAKFRLFAWNTGNTIPDEDQIGDLAITTLSPRSRRYDDNYGGVKWFGGPDEDLGYCIGLPNPPKYRPRFKRSDFTEQGYLQMVNWLSEDMGGPYFWGTLEAKNWVDAQEYWQTYTGGTAASPTPSPSNNVTPTPTPTVTPSVTQTPTPTPTPTSSAQRLAFDVDPTTYYSSVYDACVASHNFITTAYLEIGYSEPTVGAYWYTTIGGSTTFSPGACDGPSYYVFRRGGNTYAVQTGNNSPVGGCDNNGEILAVSNCSTLPSSSPTPTQSLTPTPTPSCQRPGRLNEYYLYHSVRTTDPVGPFTGITGSLSLSCEALAWHTTGYGWLASPYEGANLNVGTQFYVGLGDDCTLFNGTGWWHIYDGGQFKVIYFVDGVITTFPVSCTTPTPTPSVTRTPTPTPTRTPTPTPSSAGGGPQADAVACWALDEASGTLEDSKGSNDLSTISSVTYSQTGKVGDCVGFLSNTSKAEGGTGLAYLTDFSISFWAKRNTATTSSSRYVFSNRAYGSGSDGGFVVYWDTDADFLTCGMWNGSSIQVHPIDSDISDGNWHHIVISHNSSNGSTTGYTDNVADISSASFTNEAATGGDGRPVILGQAPQFQSYSFEGYLDQVMVWDRTLTASEVSELWNSGSGVGCGPAPTPTPTPSITPSISVTPTVTITPSTSSSPITNFYIYNASPATYNITNVTVNGMSLIDASFPVTPGNNTSGYTTLVGTYTVTVTLNGFPSGESITVQADAYSDCQDDPGGTANFTNVPINGSDVFVNYDEIGC